jgi:hypothetical protein
MEPKKGLFLARLNHRSDPSDINLNNSVSTGTWDQKQVSKWNGYTARYASPSRKLNHDEKKYERPNESRHEDSNPDLPQIVPRLRTRQVKEAVLHYTMSDFLSVNEMLSRRDSTVTIIKRALIPQKRTRKNVFVPQRITSHETKRYVRPKVCYRQEESMGASTTRPSLK